MILGWGVWRWGILSGGFLVLTLTHLKSRFSIKAQMDSKLILVSGACHLDAIVLYKVFIARRPAIICHQENDHNASERILLLFDTRSSHQAQPNIDRCLWGTYLTHSHTLTDIVIPTKVSCDTHAALHSH